MFQMNKVVHEEGEGVKGGRQEGRKEGRKEGREKEEKKEAKMKNTFLLIFCPSNLI